jgi:Domain of unknown function (DUF1707)
MPATGASAGRSPLPNGSALRAGVTLKLRAEGVRIMDRAGWNYPSGDLRVSDADRERALHELSGAFQAGRLTADEFDERSGQALTSRTGKELTALLTDLPLDDLLAARAVEQKAARAAAEERARRVHTTRIAIGASTAAAFVFAFSALVGALRPGLSPQQREIARQMMARQGVHVPAGFPMNSGFDWVGTIVPGTIAILLIAAIICLRRRLARADS